jgi:hypothetical protein
VADDRHPVLRDGDVGLDRRDADVERAAKGGERVFGREPARAAVAFEVECPRLRMRRFAAEQRRQQQNASRPRICGIGAWRRRQLTICFNAPDLYFAAILSSGSGLIFDAMPAQPNCS